ncbi:MAG: hypothetical protein IJG63_02475, partial [Oscillospiraceae bacterium]|nr:hypothetical protein [Oscillospiraceae bacterium]
MNKRIIALLLVLLLALSTVPALAADTQQAIQEPAPDFELTTQGGDIPSRYDSRDYGYVTPVKTQPWGNCWAHAACACAETYMIKHKHTDWYTGQPVTASTINLSEFHLSWFSFTDAYDRLGMLKGERTWIEDTGNIKDKYYNTGATDQVAALTMMRWEGPASEREPALAYSSLKDADIWDKGIDPKYAYTYDAAHLTDFYRIPISNTEAVKAAIMECGAGSVSCIINTACVNSANGACCYKKSVAGGSYDSAHAVTCVGWDDNYSRYNFPEAVRPSRDGAWIIKNSWGESYGDKGYSYMSYEDEYVNASDSAVYFYVLESHDNYYNNYQYDGTLSANWYEQLPPNGSKAANVFTSHGLELLKAASIYVPSPNVYYELAVYTNLSDSSVPDSGTLALEQGGTFEFGGFHTVKLKKPVPISYGENFAVVFTLYGEGSQVYIS